MQWNHIDALRVQLASPEQIRAWSFGEVTSPETIHYATGKPHPGGLFSERIFGPTKNWHCACGNYRRRQAPGFRCRKCGVEVTRADVRRERMGHIELATPVAHPWFLTQMALLLDLSLCQLQGLLSYQLYVVRSIDEAGRQATLQQEGTDAPEAAILSPLAVGDFIEMEGYRQLQRHYGSVFVASTGAATVRELLAALDLVRLADQLRRALRTQESPSGRLLKRLAVVEALRASKVDPSWLILDVLPVLPPELRPLVPLGGGRYAASDVTTLYRQVLYRNTRLKKFQHAHAPDLLLNQERRLLQDAVHALFDNRHCPHPVPGHGGHPLKSLSETLSGKQGRFRRNLLGKRVDFSGRSVIVGDPTLQLHQCRLPFMVCLELFKPFLIGKLLQGNHATNAVAAKRMVERPHRHHALLLEFLKEAMADRVVLLNRAPTLHRLSIQAFAPILSEDSTIKLHPCVCSAFNADFDGDQMAVHLPLSRDAQTEAKALLLSTHNLRSPATGEPVVTLTQEMVLGLYSLTAEPPDSPRSARWCASDTEVDLALLHERIEVQTPVLFRLPALPVYSVPGEHAPAPPRGRITTTAGRIIFNRLLPSALGFKNYAMTKERLKALVAESLQVCGQEQTAHLIDALKALGFRYATTSGISFSVLSDIAVPPEKAQFMAAADQDAKAIEELFHAGMITSAERDQQMIALWKATTEAISQRMEEALDPRGPLATIIASGATKATFQQIRQLSGMRGLMASPRGEIIPIPVRGNYLEGLGVWEIFIAASGARKGFMDRSLNTARSGYLTRRLVEAAMDVWITTDDCGTTEGICVAQAECASRGVSLKSRVIGRVLARPVSEAALPAGTRLSKTIVDQILACGVESLWVRSPLTCETPYGLCQQCYGTDLATERLVRRGAAVGIIAAQSVGEPGTQLTMRTFHSGGIAGAQGDITAGLPRVEELFAARVPKNRAPLSEIAGTVHIMTTPEGTKQVQVTAHDATETRTYPVAAGPAILVEEGATVAMGTQLTSGHPDPNALLALFGRLAAACFLVQQVQQVYRSTGVYLHDKHLECIVRQMTRYVQIIHPGETDLFAGAISDRFVSEAKHTEAASQGKTPATIRPLLLGLTKAVLQTPSWLVAASFQQTTSVLAQAALAGSVDPLRGLKEALLLGRRLPQKVQTPVR